MTRRVKILAFAGNTRRDSFNKKLARLAALGVRSRLAETLAKRVA